jgi:hypothetical protein
MGGVSEWAREWPYESLVTLMGRIRGEPVFSLTTRMDTWRDAAWAPATPSGLTVLLCRTVQRFGFALPFKTDGPPQFPRLKNSLPRQRPNHWAGPEPCHHTNSLALHLTGVTGSRDRARRLPPGKCAFLSWVAQSVTIGMGLKWSAWFAETECESAFSQCALLLIFL